MTAVDISFVVIIVGLLGCITFFLVIGGRAIYVESRPQMAACTPSRLTNITANVVQEQPRQIVLPISKAENYSVPLPAEIDEIKKNSLTYDLKSLVEPKVKKDELPIPVYDWPMPKEKTKSPLWRNG